METEGLRKDVSFPCIIHWELNHFVVLDGFKGNKAVINDPARGIVQIPMDQFDESFTGLVLTFAPGEGFEPSGKRKSTLVFARKRLKGAAPAVAFIILTSIISYLFGIINPVMSRIFFDRLLTGLAPSWLYPFLTVMAVLAVFQLIDSYTLFHFKVLVAAEGKGEHFLTSSADSRFVDTWEGLAFERVCLVHVDEIKKALQIGGVVCEVSPWRSSGDEPVQIDMLINRNDGVVNLCEMKFSREPYELTADELARMQRRRKVFKDETGMRKAVHLTMVVSPELKKNAYANEIQSTVMLDDLFRE